jgi:protein gp37
VSGASRIEWTQTTWNPVTGCDRISPGCDHCYALTLAARLQRRGQAKYQTDGQPPTSGPGFGVATHPDTLGAPLGWRRPRLVFVNSMSDLFHARAPDRFIAAVFGVMHEAGQHTFQILTKRPARMATLLGSERFQGQVVAEVMGWRQQRDGLALSWPARNVWLGTSIETDRYPGRADQLRHTPAVVRFLSLEPLLGPLPSLDLTGIDWVIVGGESGPDHRPVDPRWVRELRDRCLEAGVAFFFKQWGGRSPKAGGRLLDGRTWDQLPARMAEEALR